MIISIVVGLFLAGLYAFSVHRGFFSPSQKTQRLSQARFILKALLRLILIASVFFALLEISVLNVSVVLFSFITAVTVYLFMVLRKAALPRAKTSGAQSQGGF
ncbi:MAG: hypothetical protein ACE5F7_07920 [Nitrospiria bacterium]